MPKATSAAGPGRVIILSGPIGSGKTTVAKLLLPTLPDPAAYIEGDQFWPYIVKSAKRDKRQNFHTIMRSMTAAALPFARTGFTVLLDFSIPPDFLTTTRAILKDVPFDFIVLRPSLAICAQRALTRPEGKIADYAPYRSFYDLFAGVQHAISDDTASPEDLAERIRVGLAAAAT